MCYGQSGAGKTSLIKTLPSPIVLSAEGGLLSIQDANLPYIEIASMDNLREAYQRAEAQGFYGPPAEQYAEPVYGGRVLQVLRYREGSRHVER